MSSVKQLEFGRCMVVCLCLRRKTEWRASYFFTYCEFILFIHYSPAWLIPPRWSYGDYWTIASFWFKVVSGERQVASGLAGYLANVSRHLCSTVHRCLRHSVNTVVSSHSVMNYYSGHAFHIAPHEVRNRLSSWFNSEKTSTWRTRHVHFNHFPPPFYWNCNSFLILSKKLLFPLIYPYVGLSMPLWAPLSKAQFLQHLHNCYGQYVSIFDED